jgi:hypothetical protein
MNGPAKKRGGFAEHEQFAVVNDADCSKSRRLTRDDDI